MAPDVHPTPSSQEAAPPRWRILPCYDGSAEAKHALDRVGEIASAVPSQVAVVSVAEPICKEPRYAGFVDPGEEQSHRRLLEEAAEERILAAPPVSQSDGAMPRHSAARQ